MSITLDATLATAQDSQSRRPLIEIISSRRKDDIPFEGNALTSETFNEYGVNAIPHSSGRLCSAYCYGPDADSDCGIKFVYTDVDRLEFFTTTIELFTSSSYVMTGVTLCEMTGGNVCLAYLYTYGGNYYLASRIVTVTGTLVADSIKAIGNWATTTFTSDPWLHTLTTNSYLMLYAKQSGSDYYIYKRTSADCLTWSAESALTIAGIATTLKLDNPSILKISTGDLWLWFDVLESTSVGNPLKNIYYSVSANSGSTWSAATKFTAYDNYGSIGTHPVAVQKTADQMTVAYTQTDAALHMNDTVDVWPAGDCASELSFDSVNRKIYVVNGSYRSGNETGANNTINVVRIDIDTWVCDKYWDYTSSTPSFSWWHYGEWYKQKTACHNDAEHIYFWTNGLSAYLDYGAIATYLNGQEDNIIEYHVGAFAYGGNVNGIPDDDATKTKYRRICASHVDAANNKIWIVLGEFAPMDRDIYNIGYLTIGETPDSNGCYTYTHLKTVTLYDDYGRGLSMIRQEDNDGGFYVHADTNTIYLSSLSIDYRKSYISAIDMTTGGTIWEKYVDSARGCGKPFAIVDGKLYCTGYNHRVGSTVDCLLFSMDADTGENEETFIPDFWNGTRISYNYRTYQMLLNGADIGNGVLAMHSSPYGLALFNTSTKLWSVINNTNTPGLTLDGTYNYTMFSQIVFDEETNLIIFGDWESKGVVAVNKDGAIKRSYYSTGTYSGSAWSFTDPDNLVDGYYAYDAGLCVEPGSTSSMYAFWINWDTDTTEYSILWDKDGSTMDISDFITTDEVTTHHSIDGSPASLDFTVSHGHLFDNYNLSSALSNVLKKGNKLTLRFGEDVSGTEYWQQCGTFYVTETKISFRRGNYPKMSVKAEDRRCFWTHKHVYASEIYNNTAKEILDDILVDIGGMTAGETNIPAISTGTLQHQWMETTLMDIISQVLERYAYYFRFDYQGYAHARQISNVASIDHTYTDNTKLLDYTPDDRYSDFTNRVTVRGQELTFTEVTYDEERITTLSGTLGWWGCKAEHEVWFSNDRSRRCVNPRLEVIESSCSIAMELAGSIKEYLAVGTGTDAEKYCTVYAEAPNLVPNLIAMMAGLLAAMFIPDGVWAVGFIGNGGSTICIGSAIRTGIAIQINMVLGSIANYQYAVWAQPLGEIRRSIQGQANDTDHQVEISEIVEQVIDDPLCYSLDDCNTVAEQELMICQMQRRRIQIEKVAHLQDEDGDTISIKHPYSNQAMTLFIADITRKYKKSDPGSDNGYFLDAIEGWVCE